jgi:cyclic pyranopterin phosphate synthase
MYDSFSRHITYLRISVTDRCNLACSYCMPEQVHKSIPGNDILNFGEIVQIVRTLASLGITKIRLTGGEPLVRKDLDKLVAEIHELKEIHEITLTTNGQLLAAMAARLATAGLTRVNVSLDTLDPDRYREITRGGEIRRVFKGIEAALTAGLSPVKLNCVVTPETTLEEIEKLREYSTSRGLELRLIRQMNLGSGKFWKVEGGEGGQCSLCNRIRLTADGRFISCLFGEEEFSIREHGITKAFSLAINHKPERGRVNSRNTFHSIGG